MKNFIFNVAVCTLIHCIFATTSEARAVLLNGDGKPRTMDHFQVVGITAKSPQAINKDICKTEKLGHLPTIRELAELSQASGAKGILELSKVKSGDVPTGYYKIYSIGSDGKNDIFYYNHHGYKPPMKELSSGQFFWSASISSRDSKTAFDFNSANGGISELSRNSTNGVICFSDK